MALIEQVNSKANVKQFTNNDLPFAPAQPVLNSFYAISTSGQTSIANLGFSVDTVNNSDSFFLFVDGKKLRLGAANDYVFAAIAADGTSSQITFNQALPINLNIQAYKLGLKTETVFGADNRFTSLFEELNQGLQGFVNTTTLLSVATATTGTPAAGTFYSTISNRASMADLSQDLKSRMGIDRLIAQTCVLLQNEFGPNGENVWSVPNDQYGQVRFVGAWKGNVDATGNYVFSALTTDYLEVTFYGTGLNLLSSLATATYTFQYSVDGGSTNTFFNTAVTGVLSGKQYTPNQVIPVVAGLALGIHTVKISATTSVTASLNVCGFDFLNESSSVRTNSGIAYNAGQKITTAAQSALAYNAAVTGTRGGRVIVYQKSDGSIAQAFQAVNASSATLTSADHTNEEIARTFYPREFGAGRTDDFSLTNSAASRAFTLEDGTTTLVTSGARFDLQNGYEAVALNTNGDWISITFVGTGLDIVEQNESNGGSDTYNIQIDGGSTIALPTAGSTLVRQVKLVSGLPYGTHTVRINRVSVATWTLKILKLMVYQPKKPAIPSGAMELADYNVLANFVANTVSGAGNVSASGIATGVLRKSKTREFVFTGTWGVNQIDALNYLDGWDIDANSSGASVSYTFFGTGVEYRFPVIPSLNPNFTISIDGSTNLSGFTTNFYASNSTGVSFNAATGTVTGTVSGQSDGAGISISNLPLGVHTIKMTTNAATRQFIDCLDVITPIHSYKSNLFSDIQNALLIGSQSMSDSRKFTPIKEAQSSSKALVQANGVTAATTTTTSYVPCPDMSATIKTAAGFIEVWFVGSITQSSNGQFVAAAIYVDGIQVGVPSVIYPLTGNGEAAVCHAIVPVSAGVHKVDGYWAVSGGTGGWQTSGGNPSRLLTVREL